MAIAGLALQRAGIGIVFRESVGLILVGAGVGLAATLAGGRIVASFVAGAKPNDTGTVMLIVTVLVCAALFATFSRPLGEPYRADPRPATGVTRRAPRDIQTRWEFRCMVMSTFSEQNRV